MDRKFRVPRSWSNQELKKVAHLTNGSVINVSGWKDQDKEGARYKDYFSNSKEYWISNYKTEARGFQGDLENEIFIDLYDLKPEHPIFDVAFSHTVLEHCFDIFKAFENLCNLSRDLVIIVVPFLQEEHSAYGDYWRFTPQCVDQLFKRNNMRTVYLNYNEHGDASTYVFAIGSKKPEDWSSLASISSNKVENIYNTSKAGINVIQNSRLGLKKTLKKLLG